MNVEEYNQGKEFFAKYFRDLEAAVKAVQERYYSYYNDGTKIGSFYFADETVEVTFERGVACGCCEGDYIVEELPLDIVTAEGFSRYIKKKDEEIEKQTKAKAQFERRKEEKQKGIRKQQYEKLRKEFAG